MNNTPLLAEASVQKTTLTAVVIYEDLPTRERAAAVCDDLVKQFWPEISFKFDWWRIAFLDDKEFADLATQSALKTDFIIFSGSAVKELTATTKRWFEHWARHRNGQDGALVDLTESSISLNGVAELKKIYLRDIASRALMDYVTKPPVAVHTNLRNRRDHLNRSVNIANSFGSKPRRTEPLLVSTKD